MSAQERLPADLHLWEMPNVLIDSYSASIRDWENARIVALFRDNLRRFLAGEPLQNVLAAERYY